MFHRFRLFLQQCTGVSPYMQSMKVPAFLNNRNRWDNQVLSVINDDRPSLETVFYWLKRGIKRGVKSEQLSNFLDLIDQYEKNTKYPNITQIYIHF
jgi:hypothetical protein